MHAQVNAKSIKNLHVTLKAADNIVFPSELRYYRRMQEYSSDFK